MKKLTMFSLCLVLIAVTGGFFRQCDASDGIDLNLFHQTDYEVKFERLELLRYNEKFAKDVSVVTFKYNRTTAAVNMTFTVRADMGLQDDLTAVVQVYKFSSNEYRLFPIRFMINSCKAIKRNIGGSRQLLQCGNFSGCPLLKGKKYHVCNWYPNPSMLPPQIPNGQYKIELQTLLRSEEFHVGSAYATVFRAIV